MRRILLAAAMLAAIPAGAQTMSALVGSDPLTRQILAKAETPDGGVTAAVRVASGQSIVLKLDDVSSTPAAAEAPAASAAGLGLPRAAAPKAKSSKDKPARRAVDQLRRRKAKGWRK
ncbi:MAG: hypothetical protein KGM24_09360 [Elusimicrobia bacterium]|nr:hypothetical protein [Elusimicrobiota bacterium]